MADWLAVYARALGMELPGRVHLDAYPKGEAWAPDGARAGVAYLDAETTAGYGLAVFPLERGGKNPATPHGFKDASRDPMQLERWWADGRRQNMGIATGAVSGVVVVDLDGAEGIAAFARYVAAGGLPKTWCALTVGGAHLYFAHPGGELGNTAGKLGPKIDTRGDGGYVVAPPSVHACGVSYRWICAPWDLEYPAPLPKVVLDAWRPTRTTTAPAFSVTRTFAAGDDGDARALAQLERLADELAHAPEGQRDATLTRVAYAAGVRCAEGRLRRHAAEHALTAAARACGLTERESVAKIVRGIDAGYAGKR